MPTVVPVKFAYAARDLWFNPQETGAREGDHVVCSTARGTELGLVTHDPFEVPEEELGETPEERYLADVVRIADDDDLDRAEELAAQGEEALPTFRRLVKESGLDMKPVGVEYLFGGEKVVCYFAAEERVDFRQLVRDLARELHEKIDMRQIGVREEAAIVGGYAHCGQELCCARFGRQFEPVSIRMAKEQDLPLNSTKISGVCGRLMCCLRYEFEAYRDFKSRAPKKNAVIETPLGKAKIIEYDTPKEQLVLRLENGKQIRVPLSGMEASEAAHKKSEELGCPCRPDTVTRETLDRLDSPEVQMALAELDRANGVVPTEDFSSQDIFVEPHRKRRGRGKGAEQAPAETEQQAEPKQQAEGQGKSRRRRRRGGSGGGQAQQQAPQAEQQQAAQQGEGQGKSRRRRRHSSKQGAEAPQAQQQAAPQEQAQPSRRRRRRPGDRGGAAAQQASKPQQEAQPQQQGEGQAKRKRRRHRGRGGSGGGEAKGSAE